MKTDLAKLVEAEKSVNQLSKELVVKEKDLAVALKEADEVRENFKIKVSLDKYDTEFFIEFLAEAILYHYVLPWFG